MCYIISQKVKKYLRSQSHIYYINTTGRPSTVDKKLQRITDFIHQYLIEHMTNDTEVCSVI